MTNPILTNLVPIRYTPEQYRSLELWYDYLEETYPRVRNYEFKAIPQESKYFAVFVDYRKHPYMEYVLRNVMHFLGPEWGLQIFAWPKNIQFVRRIVQDWNYVHVVELPEQEQDVIFYDETFRSPKFWSVVKGEQQLFFDLNSLLRRRGIEQFLRYDYIGAPWLPRHGVSPQCRVGNGGLSLRRKSVMAEICRTGNTRQQIIRREDIYFSVHLHLKADRYKIPSVEDAMRFAVESVYYPDPLGVHMPWLCLPVDQLRSLLETIRYD